MDVLSHFSPPFFRLRRAFGSDFHVSQPSKSPASFRSRSGLIFQQVEAGKQSIVYPANKVVTIKNWFEVQRVQTIKVLLPICDAKQCVAKCLQNVMSPEFSLLFNNQIQLLPRGRVKLLRRAPVSHRRDFIFCKGFCTINWKLIETKWFRVMSDVKYGNPGTDRTKSLDFILRVFDLEFEEYFMLLMKSFIP